MITSVKDVSSARHRKNTRVKRRAHESFLDKLVTRAHGIVDEQKEMSEADGSTIPWVHLDDITTPAVRSKKEKKAGKSGDGVRGEPA